MCPPESIPSVIELNEHSTDEAICKSLMQFKSGCSLPLNVQSNIDPYQFTPSNLPAENWYLWSGSKTDTANGFWRSTGEASEVYSTSLIIGLRNTLQFYEGPAADSQKTNLMMQEYTTTDKYSSKLDPRALYRVFLLDASSSGVGQLSKSELLVKNSDDMAGPSARVDQSPDHLVGEYLSRGDYLELNDLDIPLSRTTSSADSSCMTRSMTSEDFFDSDALLCKLGDDNVGNDIDSQPCTGQTSGTNPAPESEPGVGYIDNTLNELYPSSSSSSSSSSDGSGKEGRKDRGSRTKKRRMMKFLCFLAI